MAASGELWASLVSSTQGHQLKAQMGIGVFAAAALVVIAYRTIMAAKKVRLALDDAKHHLAEYDGHVDVDLANLGLESLPEWLMASLEAKADDLEILDLGGNDLTRLPENFGTRLRFLKKLNLAGNKLRRLPDSIGEMKDLVLLGLKGNLLRELPESIGNLTRMRALFLSNNELRGIPESIRNMTQLRKLQASRNKFESLPVAALASLPKLEMFRAAVSGIEELPLELQTSQSLCWLALAGNPCDRSANYDDLKKKLKDMMVPLSEVKPQTEVLSDEEYGGASAGKDGVLACLVNGISGNLVLKYLAFNSKGPDGDAYDELLATVAVQGGLGLPQLAALAKDNRKKQFALVMKRIPGRPLAMKPRDSIRMLRCRYDRTSALFDVDHRFLYKLALDLSRALAYMHARGLAHGDVYAHNLLVDADGSCSLIDLGAAYFYDPEVMDCERLEMRAYGILLEEVATVCEGTHRLGVSAHELVDLMHEIAFHAKSAVLSERPTFSDVVKTLCAHHYLAAESL